MTDKIYSRKSCSNRGDYRKNLYPAEIYPRTASNGEKFRKSKIRERWDPVPLRWGVADHQISHGNTYGEGD